MRLFALIAFAAGFATCIWLFAAHDTSAMAAILAGIGPAGAIAVVAVHAPPLFFTAMAWRSLLAEAERPSISRMTLFRWLGEAVNSMLPVAQVGGDIARAAILARQSPQTGGGSRAGASVVADMTIALMTQFFFTIVGALLYVLPGQGEEKSLGIALALGIAALVTGAVLIVQRIGGLRGLAIMVERVTAGGRGVRLAGGLRRMDRELATIYADIRATSSAALWHSAGWLSHVVETWVALYCLGVPVSFWDALIIESLTSAVRSAAFAIPGGLGAQEGAILYLGLGLGLNAETALALGLVRRLREIVTGLPGLLVWVHLSKKPKI